MGAEKLSQPNQSKLGLGVGERSKNFGTRKNSSGDEDGAQILCFQLPQLAMQFLALNFILCLACCWLHEVPHWCWGISAKANGLPRACPEPWLFPPGQPQWCQAPAKPGTAGSGKQVREEDRVGAGSVMHSSSAIVFKGRNLLIPCGQSSAALSG